MALRRFLRRTLESGKSLKSRHVFGPVNDRYTGASQIGTAFSMVRGGRGARTARPGADRARQAVNCGRCEKNNGSAVETETHGGTSAKGDKRRVVSMG